MALEQLITQTSPILLLAIASLLATAIYLLSLAYSGALGNVPGPLICRLTNLWTWYHSYIGDESQQIDRLHQKYGPVLRIAPNEVVISEGQALAPVYSEKGGFLKAPCYRNFDSEGHETIFSTLNTQHRAVRSKAVMPMFSTASIRSRTADLELCVEGFVSRLKKEADRSRAASRTDGRATPVNVLNLSRGLAIDSVCMYLFGKDYGGVKEDTPRLSASLYVDSVVQYGCLFFLPPWLFNPIYSILSWLSPATPEDNASADKVNGFTAPLVAKPPRDDTYQSRLLKVGCSDHETDVQMKDVIFAGTDTTGTNFGSLLFHLAQNPEVYTKLQAEIAEAEAQDLNYNPQNLKYLDATIREGLRMSMANPTRFPRQVPPTGFTYTSPTTKKSYFLPGSTLIGLQPYTLHFNPAVFPEPHTFKPERWLNPTPEMLRDAIPFGLGPRMCIARNLAMYELCLALRAVVKSNVLRGAKAVKDKIEMKEWFNAKVIGERIDLIWED